MKNTLPRILFKPVIGIVLFTSSGILVSGCGAIMKPIFKAGVKALSEGGEELVSRTAKGVAKSSDNAFNNPAGRVVGRKVGQRAFSSSKEAEKENSGISNFNTGWDSDSSLVNSKEKLHQALMRLWA